MTCERCGHAATRHAADGCLVRHLGTTDDPCPCEGLVAGGSDTALGVVVFCGVWATILMFAATVIRIS